MKDIAIKIENLGKRYQLGEYLESAGTLRETVQNIFKAPFQKRKKKEVETLWALKDISLEVERGEVLGLIGPNGAGKSTLLKILSRITSPTEGKATLQGRVGSLLEIGTGFHPELTGRENIFLNGAILGMKRREIERKFDEIVDFSGIELFIDTPVKRYSSGMAARLAFSIAAHLDTEILLVDEVLAVGDLRFQKKCLEKVGQIGNTGKTILFVSHNMAAISRICPKTVLLNKGSIKMYGRTDKVVSDYISSELQVYSHKEWKDLNTAPGNDVVRLTKVCVKNSKGEVSTQIQSNESFVVEMEYEVLKPDYPLKPYLRVYNQDGIIVFNTGDTDPTWRSKPRPCGRYVSRVEFPGKILSEGLLSVTLTINTFTPGLKHVNQEGAIVFQIVDSLDEESASSDVLGGMGGVIRPFLDWETLGPKS